MTLQQPVSDSVDEDAAFPTRPPGAGPIENCLISKSGTRYGAGHPST